MLALHQLNELQLSINVGIKIQILMFQQTVNEIPQRNTISFKPVGSKSIIRIQKSKLPQNFFKPLTIETQPRNLSQNVQQILSTPCFGNREDQEQKKFQLHKPSQFKDKLDKEQFYSWFSKGMKPLSSRVQTVPIDLQSSRQNSRHMTQRKKRLQRVKSVQQQSGKSKSNFKILKKYQNLIGQKIQGVQAQNIYKFKFKPFTGEGIQKNFKNHFKVNGIKRGYAQTKYKQNKALNSISNPKVATNFLPQILPQISNV